VEGERKRDVNVVISPWINHSILVRRTSFREKLRVMYFVSKMLDEALHPVPLAPANG
jgi:hypothetical protein